MMICSTVSATARRELPFGLSGGFDQRRQPNTASTQEVSDQARQIGTPEASLRYRPWR
jgi:hypothetical protein